MRVAIPAVLLACVSVLLNGCGPKQQTAYLVAAGTGTMRDRTGVVAYTDENGRQIQTNEILLPFVKTIKVKPGQKISVIVAGYSPARFYTTQINLGYEGEEHETIASDRGLGGVEVYSSCVIGATPTEAIVEKTDNAIANPQPAALPDANAASSTNSAQKSIFASAKKPLPLTVDELQIQIFARDTENIKSLLDGGVNVNSNDTDGVTPLVFAAELGNDAEIVGVLLDKGADANLADAKGNTPLLSAVILDRSENVQLLLDRGADVNRKNARGLPPLIGAAALGKTAVVKILLTRQPDLTTKNPNGYTALQMAVINGHDETAQVLRDAGAKE